MRKAILILGMHRSGTSAITRTISLLGVDLPINLMPPVEGNNDTGFWESLDVYHLNDEILTSCGSRWDDWRAFPNNKLGIREKTLFKHKAYNILDKNFGNSNLFLLKDPRICRLMPFWLEVLQDLDISPLVIIPFRHPLEVSASLLRRDKLGKRHSQAIWLRHNLDAEISSRFLHRCFCSYDELLSDWRGLVQRISKELEIEWPISAEEASNKIDLFLDCRHRRFSICDNAACGDDEMNYWASEMYACLTGIEREGESGILRERIDVIKHGFDTACEMFALKAGNKEGDQICDEHNSNEQFISLSQINSELSQRCKILEDDCQAQKLRAASTEELLTKFLFRMEAIQQSSAWCITRPLRMIESRFPYLISGLESLLKVLWWTLSLQVFSQIALRRHARYLIKSRIFDTNWYIQQYPEVVLEGYNPIIYWLRVGWQKGHDPNPNVCMEKILILVQNPKKIDVTSIIPFLSTPCTVNTDESSIDTSYPSNYRKLKEFASNNSIVCFLKPALRRAHVFITDGINRRFMSPYAYIFDVFQRSFRKKYPIEWKNIRVPHQKGLVSIILPSYNGEDMLKEALDSIFAQTYRNIEVIAINDGSTDETRDILDEYARYEPRLKVFHQSNHKLPKTLSRGFRCARGEFVTWTSVDNRLKPRCIELLVDNLTRHPAWDMVYANLDIIGEDGQPLIGSEWYSNYQGPPGSQHVYFPKSTGELNIWPNNYIGAAFLYRCQVAWALGDYSFSRFTTEDYDYWMRVNEVMTLRHVDFDDCIYEYRFHSKSLTSQDEILGITASRDKLMVFDEFRRSYLLAPSLWVIISDKSINGENLSQNLRSHLSSRNEIVYEIEDITRMRLPRLWVSVVLIYCTGQSDKNACLQASLPKSTCRILLTDQRINEQHDSNSAKYDWDLFISTAQSLDQQLYRFGNDYRGWWSIPDIHDCISLCELKVKNKQIYGIERETHRKKNNNIRHRSIGTSVIVCTYQRSATLEKCLRSIIYQTLPSWEYEILIVNNEPSDLYPNNIVAKIKQEASRIILPDISIVDCPIPGLSHARNAGISEARGEILIFIDDDAVAFHNCMESMTRAFTQNPNAGVIGGHITLHVPMPRPRQCQPGCEALWSQYLTNFKEYREIENWPEFPYGALWGARRLVLLEMGGFRTNYGREGNNFGGGEEIAAALIARKMGYRVGVEPRAGVIHEVDPTRYSDQHVRKTILAGSVVNYRLHSSLYIPYILPFSNIFFSYLSAGKKFISFSLKSLWNRKSKYDALYASAYAKANAMVLILKIKDTITRFRKPICKV